MTISRALQRASVSFTRNWCTINVICDSFRTKTASRWVFDFSTLRVRRNPRSDAGAVYYSHCTNYCTVTPHRTLLQYVTYCTVLDPVLYIALYCSCACVCNFQTITTTFLHTSATTILLLSNLILVAYQRHSNCVCPDLHVMAP